MSEIDYAAFLRKIPMRRLNNDEARLVKEEYGFSDITTNDLVVICFDEAMKAVGFPEFQSLGVSYVVMQECFGLNDHGVKDLAIVSRDTLLEKLSPYEIDQALLQYPEALTQPVREETPSIVVDTGKSSVTVVAPGGGFSREGGWGSGT